ncbi:MAG: HAD hydrolase-like protein [Clostridia bacterium]|nr:HAD hydrolase-like protein [Clostridia bacterium]
MKTKLLNKRLFIFDLDGTILDTIGDIAAAVNSALAVYGFPKRSVREVQSYLGNGSLMLMKRAIPVERDDDFCREVREHFRRAYETGMYESTAAYGGICELIDELNSLGAVCAVISNKDDKNAVPMVKRYFGERFAYVRGVRGDTDRKPNPEVTLSVIRELGFTPEQTVFIGDGIADCEVSKNAGTEFVPIGYGYTENGRLFDASGKAPCESVAELKRVLIECFKRSEGADD